MSEIACAIINASILISFTVLAIVFHKWWIILFSILFLYEVKGGNK